MLRVRFLLRGNERVIHAEIADPGTCGEENQQVEDGSPAKGKPEQAGGQKWGCKCADCKATMKKIQVACRLFYDLIDCQIVDDGDRTARQTDAEDQSIHGRERRKERKQEEGDRDCERPERDGNAQSKAGCHCRKNETGEEVTDCHEGQKTACRCKVHAGFCNQGGHDCTEGKDDHSTDKVSVATASKDGECQFGFRN